MLMLRLSLTTALVACCPLYAQAAVDEAGAATLAGQLKAALSEMGGWTQEGEVAVRPDGDAFAVTLPVLLVQNPEAGDKTRVALQPITARMTPTEDNLYKYVATLSTPFATISDDQGQPRLSVSAKEQQLEGLWNAAEGFNLNDLYVLRGVTLDDSKKELAGSIAELGLVNQLTPTGPGVYNVDSSFNIRGIKLAYDDKTASDKLQVQIEALGFASSSKNFNMAALRQLEKGVDDLKKTPGASPIEALGRVRGLFTLPDGMTNSGNSDMKITMTKFNLAIGPKPEQMTHISLPVLRINGTSQSDTQTQLTDMALRYEHDGLSVTPLSSPVLADILPADVKLGFSVSRLPVVELLKTASDSLGALEKTTTGTDTTPATKEQAPSGLNTALALMQKANTELKVDDVTFAAKALNSHSEGRFVAEPNSPAGTTGTLDTRITGISELLARLGQATATPEADPMVQQVAMGLMMLQMQGKAVAGATPSAHTYHLELTPAGEVKMNGNLLISLAGTSMLPSPAEEGESHPAQPTLPASPEDNPVRKN